MGFTRARAGTPTMPEADDDTLDRLRCHWVSSGERCRYFGAHSDGTKGEGPWYCGEHRLCHDQVLGAEIVARSIRDVPHVDYSYQARRAAFLARGERQRSTSPLVASIRAAYEQSQAYIDKGLGRRLGEEIPERIREPGED